jgi:hypothetical protein
MLINILAGFPPFALMLAGRKYFFLKWLERAFMASDETT